MTDIEGVAGVVSHLEHSYSTGGSYQDSKRLLTAEVNAAVEGLVSAGVKEMLVVDGHGPGAICFEELRPPALLLHGRPITRQQLFGPLSDYDAVMLIGQHARAGVPDGNQNHTMDSRGIDWMRLNGRPVGETAVIALWAGSFDVPVIFISGDEAACREAREDVPGIATAAVKRGISSNVEICLSAVAARSLIREEAQKAVEAHRQTPVKPIRWAGPYALEIRWKTTQDADLSEHQYGCERVDGQTVCFRSPEILDVLCNRHRSVDSERSPNRRKAVGGAVLIEPMAVGAHRFLVEQADGC